MSKYARELIGTTCICGDPKVKGKSFCSECYHVLPVHMRGYLYRRIGDGYEEAYDNAIVKLKQLGKIKEET